jgi:hypothetical protein
MGRITDNWSGKQKFHRGFGREGNKKLDEYQLMLLSEPKLQPKKEIPFEERLKRAPVPKRKPTKAYIKWLKNKK